MGARIGYVDAIRGFTMLVVVFCHVEGFGFFDFSYATFASQLFSSFMMPLFFFISGFVTRKYEDCDSRWYIGSVKKKARTLLVPTLFFGLIYTYFYWGGNFSTFISDAAKSGYWFTLALFEMFLVLYTVNLMSTAREERFRILLLAGLAILMYLLKFPFKYYSVLKSIGDFSSLHFTFSYFQFFVFGLFASNHREWFERLLNHRRITAVIILMFSILFYIKYSVIDVHLWNANLRIVLSTLTGTATGYLGLLVVFALFKKHQMSVSSACRFGNTLQYVGRRTLDIYMIHYFFLPTLPEIGNFLKHSSNILIELVAGFGLSIAIMGCCIVISSVIRTSGLLAYYLFGEKTGR